MYIDPNRYTARPTDDRIPQELAIYDRLEELSIPYVRVDHDHADTIEICHEVEKVLGSKICKNLFLCNRQQTDFYLLMMPGDKPFKTKFLSAQLGCSRLSFADDGHMRDYLSTIPGSVSALELLFDTDRRVHQRPPGHLHLHPPAKAGGPFEVCGVHRPHPHLHRPPRPQSGFVLGFTHLHTP